MHQALSEPRPVPRGLLIALVILCSCPLAFLSSCGPPRSYTPRPVPGWDFVEGAFAGPPAGLSSRDGRAFEEGWRALLLGNLETAARRLEGLARKHRDLAPLESALGYLEMRLGNLASAEVRFAAALRRDPALASARAGLALAALASGRDEVAFERLRALSREQPDHALAASYLPSLQLKLAEAKLQEGRALRAERFYREAAVKYREALAIAPEANGLHAEAAEVELAGGEAEHAAQHAARALELDPDNPELQLVFGDALRSLGKLAPAVEAYARARALKPDDPSVAERYEQVKAEVERQSLPQEFFAIPEASRITREELAALLYLNLRPALERVSRRSDVIVTDAGESWAGEFIRQVVAAGLLEVYPNHTFQPRAFVRRGELAAAMAAALAALAPSQAEPSPEAPVADVPRDNLNYPAVALVVSLGLLPVEAGERFDPLRFVSGREAAEALEALARRVIP